MVDYSRFDKVDEFEEERRAFIKEDTYKYRAQEQERKALNEAQGSKKPMVGGGRTAVCTVDCNGITLKLTLKAKLLERPLRISLVEPFLGAFNKKRQKSEPGARAVSASDLASIHIDGKEVE